MASPSGRQNGVFQGDNVGFERRRRRVMRRLAIGLTVVAALLAGGFFWFVGGIPAEEVAINRKADGIVVLTGGSSRIADAVELLASGRGQRLLISGVHRTTTQSEIARKLPQFENVIACCVDLDYSAVNTSGNATETRRWVKKRHFRSLIVVTSNYHMPRAMAELSHQLPDVQLISFPVVTHRFSGNGANAATAKLLFFEYVKYIVAVARMRFDAIVGA